MERFPTARKPSWSSAGSGNKTRICFYSMSESLVPFAVLLACPQYLCPCLLFESRRSCFCLEERNGGCTQWRDEHFDSLACFCRTPSPLTTNLRCCRVPAPHWAKYTCRVAPPISDFIILWYRPTNHLDMESIDALAVRNAQPRTAQFGTSLSLLSVFYVHY